MGSACSSEDASAPRAKARAKPREHVGATSGKYVTHLSLQEGASRQDGGQPRVGSMDYLGGDVPLADANPHGNVNTLIEADDEGEEAELPGRGGPDSGPQGLVVAPRKLDPAQLQGIKVAALRASHFGETLNSDQLALLATMSELKKFSRVGERICEQDERAEVMYVVHKGEVLLEVKDAAVDNSANQAQMVRLLRDPHLKPISSAAELASPLPDAQLRAQALAEDPCSPVAPQRGLHPAAAALVASGVHGSPTAGTRHITPGHERRSSQGEGFCKLTRAEMIATEAAARIERETHEGDQPPTVGIPSGEGEGGAASSPPARANRRPSTEMEVEAEEDAAAAKAIPLADTTTLFMCVKTHTHTFGVGMWLNQGRYMYSAINNALSTHLILVPRKAFEALWMTYPTIKPTLLASLGESLEAGLSATPWLLVLPPPKLTLLTSLFTHRKVEVGTVLLEEGDVCTDESPLYFILEGEVELTLTHEKGHKSDKLLSAGSIFGELGVLLGFHITATAIAKTACTLRVCPRRWLNLFALMAPCIYPTLRAGVDSNSFHLRDEQLLEHPQIQAAFTEFCLKEFSAENVEFWQAAVRWRKQTGRTLKGGNTASVDAGTAGVILTEAANLYNRYISETSLLQINIPQSVRRGIQDSLGSGVVSSDCFAQAEKEILNLMLMDSFGRFKMGPLYHAAVAQLHAPPPRPVLMNYKNIGFVTGGEAQQQQGASAAGSNPQSTMASPPKRRGGAGEAGNAPSSFSQGDGSSGAAGAAAASTGHGGVKHGSSASKYAHLIDGNEEDAMCRPLMYGGKRGVGHTPLAGPAQPNSRQLLHAQSLGAEPNSSSGAKGGDGSARAAGSDSAPHSPMLPPASAQASRAPGPSIIGATVGTGGTPRLQPVVRAGKPVVPDGTLVSSREASAGATTTAPAAAPAATTAPTAAPASAPAAVLPPVSSSSSPPPSSVPAPASEPAAPAVVSPAAASPITITSAEEAPPSATPPPPSSTQPPQQSQQQAQSDQVVPAISVASGSASPTSSRAPSGDAAAASPSGHVTRASDDMSSVEARTVSALPLGSTLSVHMDGGAGGGSSDASAPSGRTRPASSKSRSNSASAGSAPQPRRMSSNPTPVGASSSRSVNRRPSASAVKVTGN